MNLKLYSNLLNSINNQHAGGATAFQIVLGARNIAYPNGLACNAMSSLDKKYLPTTTMDLCNLLKNYHSMQLCEEFSVNNYITSLEDFRAKLLSLGSDVSERDFMTKILNSLGEDYANASHTLMQRISNNNNLLIVEMIKEDINIFAQRFKLV